MPIYKKIKRIACLNAKIKWLVEQIKEIKDIDWDGVDLFDAELVDGLSVRSDGLYSQGCLIATDEGDYFCEQHQGFVEDSFYGYLYFRTDVPGQFVRVHFDL